MERFCENCQKNVEAYYEPYTSDFEVKGKTIHATINTCRCKECGKEVWDYHMEVENDHIVFGKYNQLCDKEEDKIPLSF